MENAPGPTFGYLPHRMHPKTYSRISESAFENWRRWTHVIERCGRPFTLVCSKTTASNDAACKIHERDLEYLARITALQQERT